MPTRLTADDYSNLIAPAQIVDTIAVAAVLAAYNWAPDTDRYRRLSLFVDKFFAKVKVLQQPPFHPKWREVALSTPLAGWTRFGPAREWLDRNSKGTVPPLAEDPVRSVDLKSDEDRELFRQFLEQRKRQLAPRHSRVVSRGHVPMKYRRAVSARWWAAEGQFACVPLVVPLMESRIATGVIPRWRHDAVIDLGRHESITTGDITVGQLQALMQSVVHLH